MVDSILIRSRMLAEGSISPSMIRRADRSLISRPRSCAMEAKVAGVSEKQSRLAIEKELVSAVKARVEGETVAFPNS